MVRTLHTADDGNQDLLLYWDGLHYSILSGLLYNIMEYMTTKCIKAGVNDLTYKEWKIMMKHQFA